jgi:hypothetical protein
MSQVTREMGKGVYVAKADARIHSSSVGSNGTQKEAGTETLTE